jgi:hypothetical protein
MNLVIFYDPTKLKFQSSHARVENVGRPPERLMSSQIKKLPQILVIILMVYFFKVYILIKIVLPLFHKKE